MLILVPNGVFCRHVRSIFVLYKGTYDVIPRRVLRIVLRSIIPDRIRDSHNGILAEHL